MMIIVPPLSLSLVPAGTSVGPRPLHAAGPAVFTAVAIFCPFGLFCEIVSSLLSLQNHQEQPSVYFRRR